MIDGQAMFAFSRWALYAAPPDSCANTRASSLDVVAQEPAEEAVLHEVVPEQF